MVADLPHDLCVPPGGELATIVALEHHHEAAVAAARRDQDARPVVCQNAPRLKVLDVPAQWSPEQISSDLLSQDLLCMVGRRGCTSKPTTIRSR